MNRVKFTEQWLEFVNQSSGDGRFSPLASDQYAVLNEDTETTEIHHTWDYLVHTGWAARQLAKVRPRRHVDFGSYVYFAGLCSAFVNPFFFYDVRPIWVPLAGLQCLSANLTALKIGDGTQESVSCLHTLEHIGLGRYGDTLDAQGDIKAAGELSRILSFRGYLLIVVPLDSRPRVVFNAHRFYSYEQVLDLFKTLRLMEFTLIHGQQITYNADPKLVDNSGKPNTTGCFVFTKD